MTADRPIYLKPTTERCPACWGHGGDPLSTPDPDPESSFYGQPTEPCPLCRGAGRCEPIPARGQLGIWTWTPEGAS